MPNTLEVTVEVADSIVAAIDPHLVTARLYDASNTLLWEGSVTATVAPSGDGIMTITTDPAIAVTTGTPAQMRFFDGSNQLRGRASVGAIGSGSGFERDGDITQGQPYSFTSAPIAYPFFTP